MPLVSDTVYNFAAGLVAIALVIIGLIAGKDILIPLALACILAFILAPVVNWLLAHHVPHGVAVSGIMALVVLSLMTLILAFSAQMLSVTTTLESNRHNLVTKLRDVIGKDSREGILGRAVRSFETLEKAITSELKSSEGASAAPVVVKEEKATDGTASLMDLAKSALGPLTTFLLTILFTAFLLLQYHDLRDRIVRVLGTDNMSGTTAALSDAGDRLGQVFLGQAMLNAGFGVFIAIALWLVGVPNAFLWGATAALLRFVPYIGAFLSALPPLLLAAAVDPTWTTMLAVAAIFIISEPIMGHVLDPLVLGKRAGLSPFAMITAASFWTLVWGPIGLLVAAPLTMVLVVMGENVPQLNFLAVLLGDKPALDPKTQFYHRLLSNDAAAAIEQIDIAIESESAKRVADTVVLPALRLAALDQRRGRVTQDQIGELQETMHDVIAALPDIDGAASQAGPASHHVAIIPARGAIDMIASRFASGLLEKTRIVSAESMSAASGMMALASLHGDGAAKTINTIVLSTVGGMDARHLRFLAKRAQKEFPRSTIIISDWGQTGDTGLALPPVTETLPDVHVCNSMTELLTLLQIHAPKKASADDTSRVTRAPSLSPA